MFTSVHELLSAEKMACCKTVSEEIDCGPPDVTDLWSSAVSLSQEDQSDCIPFEIFSFSEAATSDFFLEDDFHQVGSISLKLNSTCCTLILMCNIFHCMCPENI